MGMVYNVKYSEAALHRCSEEILLWKSAANIKISLKVPLLLSENLLYPQYASKLRWKNSKIRKKTGKFGKICHFKHNIEKWSNILWKSCSVSIVVCLTSLGFTPVTWIELLRIVSKFYGIIIKLIKNILLTTLKHP